MCGICGFAYASTSGEAESRVRAMANAMQHRGPDDVGILASEPRIPGLALGMRRLSIIDLAGGHQPLWNETRDVAVVFIGELYIYRDLRWSSSRAIPWASSLFITRRPKTDSHSLPKYARCWPWGMCGARFQPMR